MATNPNPLENETPITSAKRVCGTSKMPGHDRRKCSPIVSEVEEIPVDEHMGLIPRVVPPAVAQPDRESMAPKIKHVMVKIPGNPRLRCSYCAITSTTSRTRFMCEGCGVPYCSIGSGKTTRDCFALAHDNEQIRELCVGKHASQQKHTSKKRRRQDV